MESKFMKYIIYQTVNKVNGKLYIGVHKTKDPNVFDGYIGNGIKVGCHLKNPKTTFQYALKKYGYSNFIRTTLYVYETADEAFAKEAEIVDLKWVRSDNNYNIVVGGKSGGYTKVLYQFDYSGKLIKTWDACFEAIEYYGCHHLRFTHAIRDKRSAFESYWSYSPTIDVTQYKRSRNRIECYQFDLEGNLLHTWPTTHAALETLHLSKASLYGAITSQCIYKKSYWTFDKDSIYDIIKRDKLFNRKSRTIGQYDINHNLICEYINKKTASKDSHVKYSLIDESIKTGCLVDNKYYFSYICVLNNPGTKIKQFDKDGNLVKIWDSVSQCLKEHPKCREVLKGIRSHTHGFTFEYFTE